MSKFFWNFDTGVQINIFCFLYDFARKFFQKLWKEFNLFSPYLILYNRKHFCSISTNLSNLLHSKWPFLFHQTFPLLSSDLKNMLTKYFLKMQPFANVLQNRCSNKFPDIHKKISVLKSFFKKVTGLMAGNFIKKEIQHRCFPVNITKSLIIVFLT